MLKCTSLAPSNVRPRVVVAVLLLVILTISGAASAGGVARSQSTEACISALPESLKVGQLLLPIVSNPSAAVTYVGQGLITGVVAIGTVNRPRAKTYQSLLTQPSPIPILLASDEEGGTVQRYRALLGEIPSAQQLGATFSEDEVTALFSDYGKRLRKWGVTVALAPVADVSGGPGIGSRSFSDDPSTARLYARAVATGYLSAGVVPVYKHFPGHGRATADTHKALALTPSLRELRRVDLVPYEDLNALSGVSVMVGHLAVPGLTKGAPATVSPEVINGLLRRDLGFSGVVMSDAFGMGAIAGYLPIDSAATRFVLAGGDVLILPSLESVTTIHASLLQAIRRKTISSARLNESVRRVMSLKKLDPCGIPAPLPARPRN